MQQCNHKCGPIRRCRSTAFDLYGYKCRHCFLANLTYPSFNNIPIKIFAREIVCFEAHSNSTCISFGLHSLLQLSFTMARTAYKYTRLDSQPCDENASLIEIEDSPESLPRQIQTSRPLGTRILFYGLLLTVLLSLSFATGFYAARTGRVGRKQ